MFATFHMQNPAAFYNREELTTSTPAIVLPSPEPIITPTFNSLCYEANVLTFGNSNMLGSANLYNIDVSGVRTAHWAGWAAITFSQPVQVLTPAASTVNGVAAAVQPHRGLPVVGFAIQDFANGNVGGVASNYGGSFVHKYLRSIGTTP